MITPNARLLVLWEPDVPMIDMINRANQKMVSMMFKIMLALLLAQRLNRAAWAVTTWYIIKTADLRHYTYETSSVSLSWRGELLLIVYKLNHSPPRYPMCWSDLMAYPYRPLGRWQGWRLIRARSRWWCAIGTWFWGYFRLRDSFLSGLSFGSDSGYYLQLIWEKRGSMRLNNRSRNIENSDCNVCVYFLAPIPVIYIYGFVYCAYTL